MIYPGERIVLRYQSSWFLSLAALKGQHSTRFRLHGVSRSLTHLQVSSDVRRELYAESR